MMNQQEGQQWAVVPWSDNDPSSDVAVPPTPYTPSMGTIASNNNPAIDPWQPHVPFNEPHRNDYDPNNPAINLSQPSAPVVPDDPTARRTGGPSQSGWGITPLQNENIGQHTQPQSEWQELRNRYMALKVDHSKLRAAKASTDSQLGEVQYQLQSLHGHYSSLHEQYNALQFKNRALREEYATTHGNLAELTAVHAAAGEDGDKALKFIEELKQARDEAVLQRQTTGDKLRKLRVENSDLKDDKRSLEQELLYANQQVKLLQTQMADRQNAVDKGGEEHRQDAREATWKLRRENQELRDANKAMEDQLKEANQQVQGLAAKCADLMDRTNAEQLLQHTEDKLGFLRKENGDLRDAKLALTDQLRQANEDLQKERKMNEDLSEKILELREANMSLKTDGQTARRELETLQDKYADLEDKMENKCARLEEKAEDKEKYLKEANWARKNEAFEYNQKVQSLESVCSDLKSLNDKLRHDRTSLETLIRGLEEKCKSLESNSAEMQKTEAELKDRLRDAETKSKGAEDLRAELGDLKRINADAEDAAEQMKAQNTHLRRASVNAQERVMGMRNHQENLQEQLDEVNSRLSGLNSENSSLRGDVKLLQKQLKDERKELEKLRPLNRSLHNELHALKAERRSTENLAETTEQQLKAAIDTIGALEAKLKLASIFTKRNEDKLHTSQEHEEAAQSLKDALLEELAKAKTANAKTQGELQTVLEHNLVELKAAHEAMKGELRAANIEIEALEAGIDDMAVLQKELSDLKKSSKTVATEKKALEVQLERTRVAAEAASKKFMAAEEALSEKEAKIDALKSDLSTQHHQKEKAIKEADDLKEQLSESQNAVQELQALANQHKQEAEKTEKDKEEVTAQLAGLEGAVDKYRTIISQLEAEAGEIVEHQRKINMENQSLKTEITKLQEALDGKSSQHSHAQDALEKAESLVEEHRENLKVLKDNLRTSNKEIVRLEQELGQLRANNAEAMEALRSTHCREKERLVKELEEQSIKNANDLNGAKSECDELRAKFDSKSTRLEEALNEADKLQKFNERQQKKMLALEDELIQCRDDNEALEAKQRKQTKSMGALKREKDDFEAELESAQVSIREKDASQLKSKKLIAEQADTIAELKQGEKKLESEHEAALKRLEELNSEHGQQLIRLEATALDLAKTKAAKSSMERALEEEFPELDSFLSEREVRGAIQSLKLNLREARNRSRELDQLKNAIQDLTVSGDAMNQENEQLRKQVVELGDKVRKQAADLRQTQSQSWASDNTGDAMRQIEELRRQMAHLDRSKEAALRESGHLRRQISESEEAVRQENDQLRRQISDLDISKDAAVRESVATSREHDRLRKQIADLGQSKHAASRENEELRKRIADMNEKDRASRRECDQLRRRILELEDPQREQTASRSLPRDTRNNSAALSKELDDRKDELMSLQQRHEELGKAHQGLVKASRDAAIALSGQLEDRNKDYEELRKKFRNANSELMVAKEKLLKLEDADHERKESLKHLRQKLNDAKAEINGLKWKQDQVRLELEEATATRDSALESKKMQEAFMESLRERLKSDGQANNEKNESLMADLLLMEKTLSENESQLDQWKSKLRQMALDKRSLNKDYMGAKKRMSLLESQLCGSQQACSEAMASKDIVTAKLKSAEVEMEKLVETLGHIENDFNARESESQAAYQNLLDRAQKLEETLENELNLVRGKLCEALSSNSDLQSCCDRAESDLKMVACELSKLLQLHEDLPPDQSQEGEEDDPLKSVAKVMKALNEAIGSRDEAIECNTLLQQELERKGHDLEGKEGELREKKQELVEVRRGFAKEKEKLLKDLNDIEADVQKASGENKELLGHLRLKLNDAEGQGEKLQSQLKDAEGKGDRLHHNLVAANKAKKYLFSENKELKKRLDEAMAAVATLNEKAANAEGAGEFASLRAENKSLEESLRKALQAIEEMNEPGAKKQKERTFALELTLADRDKRLKEVLWELQQKDSDQGNLHKEALKLKWFLEEFLDEAKKLVEVLKEAADDPELDRLHDSLDSSRKRALVRLEGLVKNFEMEFEDRNGHQEDFVNVKESAKHGLSPTHSEADGAAAVQSMERHAGSNVTGESVPLDLQVSKFKQIAVKSPSSFRLNLPQSLVHGKASPRHKPQGRAPPLVTAPESAVPPVTRTNGGPKAHRTSNGTRKPAEVARPISADDFQARHEPPRLAESTASTVARGQDQNRRSIGAPGATGSFHQPHSRGASSGGRSLAKLTMSRSRGLGNDSTKNTKSVIDPPPCGTPTKKMKDVIKESARRESPLSRLDKVRWTTATLS